MPFSRDRLKRRRMPPLEDKVFDNQQYRRPQRPSIMPGPGGNRPSDIKFRTQGSAPASQRPSIMPGPGGNRPDISQMVMPGGGLVSKGQGLGKYNPGGGGSNMFMPGGGGMSQGRPSIMPGPRGQRPQGRGLGRFNPGGERLNQRQPLDRQMYRRPGRMEMRPQQRQYEYPQRQMYRRPGEYGGGLGGQLQISGRGRRQQMQPLQQRRQSWGGGMERGQQRRPMSRRMQRQQMYSRGRPSRGGGRSRRPMQRQQRWGAY